MAETARTEYPAMLAYLQPSQAVHVLNDRVKRVSKLNLEIADWLQERRKVEEQYIQGLRRLVQFKVPNSASELGIFQGPWDKVLRSVESTAHSHYLFASNLEKDVEAPLRAFSHKKEVHSIQTIGANLASMARELEDAQDKSDKLTRKGTKASTQKVDAAATRLSAASQEWESQAPFIFETLQVLDEQRTNQLRDLLTQLLTHESDQAQRNQTVAGEALQAVLDLQTPKEIENFSKKMTDGKAKQERRSAPATRRPSAAGSNLTPPATATTAASHEEDLQSEAEAPEPHQTPRLRSRIGTMLGRRRQSIHGGFGPLTQKSSSSFGRNLRSSHGRGVSPRASMNDLTASNKLPSLAETPDTSNVNDVADSDEKPKDEPHEGTNGVKAPSSLGDLAVLEEAHDTVNGTDAGEATTAFAPPPGPPPAQAKDDEESQGKDSEGFTIPLAMNDPISQAQREAAAEEAEQLFKLNIQSTPVAQDDPEATQAALSNVSNALTQMGMPSRKTGTIRGRRDVRNTIYVPAPNGAPSPSSSGPPPTPPVPNAFSRSSTLAALASEASIAGTSDTQSVRSGNSLGALNHAKHPDKLGPGLHASIIETITATFEEDVMKTAKINGEIAFCYNADEDPDSKSLHNPTIRINNFPRLEVIGPNRIFVQNSLPDRNDQFALDVSHLSRTSTAFSYRIHSESNGQDLAPHAPLLIKSLWKPKGDKLELLMHYSLNPTCSFASPVTLHNVVVFATYEDARASGAQTKPSGTHLKEKHLVYWRLGDITLTSEPQKIVCRILGAEGAHPKPGHIEARWEYSPNESAATSLAGISVSRLEESKGKEREAVLDEDPFADSDNVLSPPLPPDHRWVDVPMVYKLVSGKYETR